MPTYHIEMMEGRTIEQKRRLVQEITRITVEVLGGSPDSVEMGEPGSIGCIRMKNSDIVSLFDQVLVGTTVDIT